jgi:hypothetical protein
MVDHLATFPQPLFMPKGISQPSFVLPKGVPQAAQHDYRDLMANELLARWS